MLTGRRVYRPGVKDVVAAAETSRLRKTLLAPGVITGMQGSDDNENPCRMLKRAVSKAAASDEAKAYASVR
jgi:hypothetical protein